MPTPWTVDRWNENMWPHLGQEGSMETLFEEGERTHAARTKLLEVVNLSIEVIGHNCRGKVNRLPRGKNVQPKQVL